MWTAFRLFFQRPWRSGRVVTVRLRPIHRRGETLAQNGGGGLRQAGVLAAAIEYALDHHVDRLRLITRTQNVWLRPCLRLMP